MRKVALYLRVSTLDRTTANQERELRAVADRMGCEIVHVYKDHGVSGAEGRDKRTAIRRHVPRRHQAAIRRSDGVVGGPAWPVATRLGWVPVRNPRPENRPVPSSTGHHHTGRQSDVPDDGRVCRIRARHDPRTGPRRPCAGQG